MRPCPREAEVAAGGSSSCRSFASDSSLAVPGADVTYDCRRVGQVVHAHVDTGFEFLWHDPAGCEHHDAAR
jgi:hypothetical protein